MDKPTYLKLGAKSPSVRRSTNNMSESMSYLVRGLMVDNTKDPFTGKYMLQSYGQYNVGVLLVRFVQLYVRGLKNNLPLWFQDSYNNEIVLDDYFRIRLLESTNIDSDYAVVDELPQVVEIRANSLWKKGGHSINADYADILGFPKYGHSNNADRADTITMIWPKKNREDKLYKLILNEDTGIIYAHFRDNNLSVIKSSDGRIEHLMNDLPHRPQEEGPAVFTAAGDYEYWENGEHIRTEGGQYINSNIL